MRKFLIFVSTLSLVSGLAAAPSSALTASGVAAKVKITKPSAPNIVSIVSSAPKKGKVNLKVSISLPTSNGGSKITGSKVTAGGKSCMIKKTKTSCTIKAIKNGKTVKVSAKSKNKKGYGPASAKVTYVAGASAYQVPVVSLTCANGGTCTVGETGPGGGIVYYVDSSVNGFTCGPTLAKTCHYLEVAPNGWDNDGTPADDPAKVWAVMANININVDGITDDATPYNDGLAIGLGYKNSDLIVAQNGTYNASSNDYAAGAARSYESTVSSVTYRDWYLPTNAELNLLCQWNRGIISSVTTVCTNANVINSPTYGAESAGFVASYYSSSSERVAFGTTAQDFLSGNQDYCGKQFVLYVRPIRAF